METTVVSTVKTESVGRFWKGLIDENGIKVECRTASINAVLPVIESYEVSVSREEDVKMPDGKTVKMPVHIGNANLTKGNFGINTNKPELRGIILANIAKLEAGIVAYYTPAPTV